MYKIAVIGAGQLGSRHIQGLLKLQTSFSLEIVEPNSTSVETCKSRIEEIPDRAHVSSISFKNSASELSPEIDLCIIATNSAPRAGIIKELLNHSQVKNLILEKFLFNRMSDFAEIKELLDKKNVKTWVNCARRSWKSYQDFKKELTAADHKIQYVTVNGVNWGVGCNAVHYLDLFAYLTNNKNISVLSTHFTNMQQSKRAGYYDFCGTILAENSAGARLVLNSTPEGQTPGSIEITSNNGSWLILESQQRIVSRKPDNKFEPQVGTFDLYFQSQISGVVAKEIFETGNCSLTNYDDSMGLHLELLKSYIPFFKQHDLFNNDSCPIT